MFRELLNISETLSIYRFCFPLTYDTGVCCSWCQDDTDSPRHLVTRENAPLTSLTLHALPTLHIWSYKL